MIGYYESQQQSPLYNSQLWAQVNPQLAQLLGQHILGQQVGGFGSQGQFAGLGQAAFGQPYGQYGGQQFGQPNLGASGQFGGAGVQLPWGLQQRQLSPQDAGEVVRQLVPLLPQIIAQAQQQQPQAAFGYGGFSPRQLTQQDVNEVVRQLVPLLPQIIAQAQQQQPQAAFGYGGFSPRQLTQQDVNEVLRQIMPIVPQIIAQLQGQQPMHAIHAGYGLAPQAQQNSFGQMFQQPVGQQQPFGQQAWPQVQAAFGGFQPGQTHSQRQLTQQDVADVVRQLVGVIPQVIQNMQAANQQRAI